MHDICSPASGGKLMCGRVLVVEDSAIDRAMIRARLCAEYYEVIEVETGEQALLLAGDDPPDLVLLDLGLPGMHGLEVCRRLKSDPRTAHIPIVILTASDARADRMRGLELGADDFLTKPFDDLALLSRAASLTRMKMMVDELLLLGENAQKPFLSEPGEGERLAERFSDAELLIITTQPESFAQLSAAIEGALGCTIRFALPDAYDPGESEIHPDAVLIDTELGDIDPLRLGARIRARARTRHVATLLIVPFGTTALAARALQIGFSDYIAGPVDPAELVARIRLQLRRKSYADRLRTSVRDSMIHAITDPLTGLYNRRHANVHLDDLVDRCRDRGSMLTIMLLDLDCFKSINDAHGHAAGDMVLREFAQRLKKTVRSVDLVARIGGEEFMVVMPEAGIDSATEIVERVRSATADQPFTVSASGDDCEVTVSIGYAALEPKESSLELVERADRALYASKKAGRNRATFFDASMADAASIGGETSA